MTAKASAGGFLLLLVALPVMTDPWGVIYPSAQICAPKGSTVNIPCSFTYPETETSEVEKRLWFVFVAGEEPAELKTLSDYAGRVHFSCQGNECNLMITDLRKNDSALYKFRFETNIPGGKYTGEPGVSLSVTDLWVQVTRSGNHAELRCRSGCALADSYVWYRNEEEMDETSSTYRVSFNDKNNYSCAFGGYEEFRSPPVYAPRLPSVSVSPSAEIVEGSSVNLTCRSDANPAAHYTWYKENRTLPREEPQLVFSSIQSSDSGQFYCEADNQLGTNRSESVSIDVKYAPKRPSVSVRPSKEVMEGSSVNLTCSSDANPAASYTWYKENEDLKPLSEEPHLAFSSIQSSDSGQYYCKAENKLGTNRSESISIEVKYAPKLASVSVSPSAEMVEGSSVNLTCSSDANPAANCTWYKENQPRPLGEGDIYRFTSISSEDSGIYYCKSENQYGEIKSSDKFINVQYAPRLPSVSVSSSAEIVEDSSVTLTCSSDANPAASYTWYKENEDSPKASGQIFIITDLRTEHSGNYSCEAQNTRGRRSVTFCLIVVADHLYSGAWILIAVGTVPALFLAIILIAVFLWILKKRSSKQPSEHGGRPDTREQMQPAEPEDGLHYATVHFSKKQADPVFPNIGPAEKEETIVYATMTFNAAASRTGGQEAAVDPAALYSTVNKKINL